MEHEPECPRYDSLGPDWRCICRALRNAIRRTQNASQPRMLECVGCGELIVIDLSVVKVDVLNASSRVQVTYDTPHTCTLPNLVHKERL